ncbi:MAG: hypothetical protein AB7S69_07470 [Salinivirgaceae bacterium]
MVKSKTPMGTELKPLDKTIVPTATELKPMEKTLSVTKQSQNHLKK